MGKGSKILCKSASHQLFKDKAKNRVDDLQGMFTDLQFARKASRTGDVAVLEEQVHQMLREWKAELNASSPASSLLGGSTASFSSDICRMLQRCDEEDDATSPLAEPPNPKLEPDDQSLQAIDSRAFQEDYFTNQVPEENGFQGVDQCKSDPSEVHNASINNLELISHLDYHQFDLHQDFDHNIFIGFNGTGQCGEDGISHITGILPSICPPPSAFLGPKCALWDCSRPAQGSEWGQDYCSSIHATLALNEGPPGMTPVVRPRGIGLKDGPLFAALGAKTLGKNVGIPECEGAATTKSPWNAPELFDLSVLEGETIREWLFFDKPRRAFESGNRKQRSLPDYSGRGWHESRKQVMKEYGGLKRSYYMDPQPLNHIEWHLYEYEINNCDACALYRLELKLVDGKKSPKGKVTTDSLADLQKQMGRLTAEFPADNKRSVKGRVKVSLKGGVGNVNSAPSQIAPTNEAFGYGVNAPYGYLVENFTDYYGT
ncbi:transcription factor VOZ1-like [Telopea speciosissima]|uniref:transcription factor VOZ1-like n=1 Tax=Telopea speciosissima TaxID=54955 RepID=UPI001CC3F45D|nr:transcription factor VOZ1-like [Telopea speciosissima]XP_043702301.1 transcription factor VOZ1-like [Telopea speciosissima]XP_043702302.1 transcription factor VOZ1-like [Telopea speciosissima]